MLEGAAIPDLAPPPLQTRIVGARIHVYDTVDSTNKMALESTDDGAVFVADAQRAGRGRQGNAWHSAPGLGLWFSVALAGAPQGLTFAAALAVRDAAREHAALQVKWPNDLLASGKKVCGMLVEHRAGWSALGIGINVNHRPEDFPAELRGAAASLAMASGAPCARGPLLGAILEALDARIVRLRDGGHAALREEWAGACAIVGRRIRRGDTEGVVTALDEEGALIVETSAGAVRVVTGEIQYSNGT